MPTTPAPTRRASPQTEITQDVPAASEGRLLISDLLGIVEQYLDSQEVKAIYEAYLFGAEAHEGQVRHSGEAYIFHPLSVARILADIRLDSRSIMAALLHDVIEDTPTAKGELSTRFGKDVAQLVDGVSKIDQIEFESREHAEAENFRKMLLAMAQDIRVILIKLADRIHNMRTLGALKADKRKRIATQTLDIFAPIANRLGMRMWTQELEDLSFCNLYPKRYNTIRKELDTSWQPPRYYRKDHGQDRVRTGGSGSRGSGGRPREKYLQCLSQDALAPGAHVRDARYFCDSCHRAHGG